MTAKPSHSEVMTSHHRNHFRLKFWLPYLLVLPAFVAIAVVIIYPMLYSIYLSLTDANLLRLAQARFIGLDNYFRLFSRRDLWQSLGVTLQYTVSTVALSFLLGLVTALMLNVDFWGKGLARTLISIPWATPWLVVTLIWYVMFNPQIGPVNTILQRVGLVSSGVSWLYQSSTALWSITVVTAWRLFPAATLLILAGLQSISPELYAAAKVDGASTLQRFRFVTLPSLRAVNLTVVVLLSIWVSKLFTIAYTLTGGGPGNATRVISVYTYQEAFTANRLGRASALAVITVVLSLVLVSIYFKLQHRQADD